MEQGGDYGLTHLVPVQLQPEPAILVELRPRERNSVLHVSVEDASGHNGEEEDDVEGHPHFVLKDADARVPRPERVVEHEENLHYVPPEGVQDELARAEVIQAAVHQQQPLQKAELADGKVRRVHGLPPFSAADAYAHLRLLNHGHVVGTIAHRQCHRGRFDLAPHKLHHLGLLQRRDPACYHDRATLGDLQELVLHARTHEPLQRLARDHDAADHLTSRGLLGPGQHSLELVLKSSGILFPLNI
mmetsp:Transcript_52507/g.140566  ORF Transcript_52507/g.140566 Transcript_52507/m.140566 type:complete len:245 (-) Transcript_52507:2150-2884(-)